MKKYTLLLISLFVFFTTWANPVNCETQKTEGEIEIGDSKNYGGDKIGGYGGFTGKGSYKAESPTHAEGGAELKGKVSGVFKDLANEAYAGTAVEIKGKVFTNQVNGPGKVNVELKASRGDWAVKHTEDGYGYGGSETGGEIKANKESPTEPVSLDAEIKSSGSTHIKFTNEDGCKKVEVTNQGESHATHNGVGTSSVNGNGTYGAGIFGPYATGSFSGGWEYDGKNHGAGIGTGFVEMQKTLSTTGFSINAKVNSKSSVKHD